MNLSFYTPIAYDWKYSITSILSYYDIADEIILAIDENNISWSNKQYVFDSVAFNNRIKEIDINQKIKIITSNFHAQVNPLDNDTAERNYITTFCKKDNYIIGIDSDEILLNSIEFKTWIDSVNILNDIRCKLITVYKNFGNRLLTVYPDETTVIGTKLINSYVKCRNTRNKTINSILKILHFSWARNEDEMLQKLKNWGHSNDFNIYKAFDMWKTITLENYQTKTMLHPLRLKQCWTKLNLIDLSEFKLFEDLIKGIKEWNE